MDKIKLLIMDVDGTLTDGKVYIASTGELFKAFDVKDGLAIKELLPEYSIIPVIITGRTSSILQKRCQELNIQLLLQGISDKRNALESLLQDFRKKRREILISEIAYIGDDINDFDCMQYIKNAGGIIGCPNDAVLKIKDIADYISSKNGGDGAVREFVEWILALK